MNGQGFAHDKTFFSRLEDIFSQVQRIHRSRFTSFLDERQQALAETFLKSRREENTACFFGGWEEAQRKILGVFPEPFQKKDEVEQSFPVVPLTFFFRKEDPLSHRDFLGSLMALEIKRELVGDILVEPGLAVVFLTVVSAQVAQSELQKIGRVGVKIKEGLPDHLPKAFELSPVKGTVSSMRLDSVTALVTNLSRDKAAALIKSGAVSVNFFENTQISELLKEGDILSIRGWGRYVVSQIGGESKKGRIHLTCGKYV